MGIEEQGKENIKQVTRQDCLKYLGMETKIVTSIWFSRFLTMNPDSYHVSDFIGCLADCKEKQGEAVAMEKLVALYRVNPMVATKALVEVGLYHYKEDVLSAFKMIFNSIMERQHRAEGGQSIILNHDKSSYMALFIEAAYLLDDDSMYVPVFLNYAFEQDRNNQKSFYLKPYNIKHIFNAISAKHKIDLLNWFWDKHMYVHNKYGKNQTYASRQVEVMVKQLEENSLLKNCIQSHQTKEQQGMITFLENVIKEGNYIEFVELVLGRDHLEEKLQSVLSQNFVRMYYKAIEDKKRRLERELYEQKLQLRKNAYASLVRKVKNKYTSNEMKQNQMCWYDIWNDGKADQINLWTYWQGIDFEDVKIMMIGKNWGYLKQNSPDMQKTLKSIQDMRKGRKNDYVISACRNTEKTLADIYKLFNYPVRGVRRTDMFFTNLCLGYRKSKQTSVTDSMLKSDADEFLKEEIGIVQPQHVVCLGMEVYKVVCETLGITTQENDTQTKIEILDGSKKHIKFWCMPDCSPRGLKEVPWEQQIEKWRKLFEEIEK